MSRPRTRQLAVATFGISCMVVLFACSAASNHPPPAGDSTASASGGGSSGTTSGDGGSDTGAATDGAATDSGGDGSVAPSCTTPITRQGTMIAEVLNNVAAPTAIGGAIMPGTYDLTLYEQDDPAAAGSGLTGRSAQTTLVVTASSIVMSASRVAADAGAPVETVAAWTYVVEGTSLVETSVCPTAGQLTSIHFSAVGGALALFPDATHRELYQKR